MINIVKRKYKMYFNNKIIIHFYEKINKNDEKKFNKIIKWHWEKCRIMKKN